MKLQPLSSKQRDFLLHSDARLNIAFGSVRSGKTLVSLLRWLHIVATAPEGANLLIAGKTERTVRRNLLDLIQELIPPEDFRLNSGFGECIIYGRKCYLVGANDERAENKIRGISLYAAYCDELTLFPESFVQMLLSRLSDPGAILLATTNPDSPYHYVKTNFLDRVKDLNLKYWQFHLEDNKTLPAEYISDLKSEYSPGSVWYKRYILGEFSIAEGAIYDMFDVNKHVVHGDLPQFSKVIVGVDYGTSNPTAFVSIGKTDKAWIAFKEYYFDSRKASFQKTDAEYSSDMAEFLDQPAISIQVDPSAASFKLQLARDGFKNVEDADNSVLDGIREVAMGFSTNTLLIHESCTTLIEQLLGYHWDQKAQVRGEDKPVKAEDHMPDSLRYAFRAAMNGAPCSEWLPPTDNTPVSGEGYCGIY